MPDQPRTLTETRDAIAAGELTAEQAARDALDRISATDDTLRAFLQVFSERAIDDARKIDRRLASGDSPGPLAGVPVAIKDNICLDRGRTTCASRILENYESPFPATAARKLLDAGAVVIGKTNMDEFAMGSSGEHSAIAPTRNPWDTGRVTGGSSSGSAAAVASGMTPGALGSDTGGSIRQPGALTGVVGVKPTYGRVSRWGLVAFASSLDQIGPLAPTVGDCALLLDAITGFDPRDSTSVDRPPTNGAATFDQPLESHRLGVPAEARSESNHPDVARSFDRAVKTFRDLGAQIIDVELPNMRHAISAYYVIAPAEASSNLARYDGIRYGRRAEPAPGDDLFDLYCKTRAQGFGPEVQRRIMLGTHALSSGYYDAYYLTAMRVRRLIQRDFASAFSTDEGAPACDAIIMPATPEPAFRIGAKADDPLAMYLEDYYTVPANMAGLCAMSVPCEPARSGGAHLPLGLQIYCPPFEEQRMLRIARMFEKARGPAPRPPI